MSVPAQFRKSAMNLKFLETFLWVGKLKSFSAAAEKLNITQAAVSSRIASLERDLGIRLFERTGRDIQLTTHGVRAQQQARAIVDLSQTFLVEMSNPESYRSTIRMGVIDTVAYSWFVDLINKAQVSYPNVRFALHADTSLAISDLLVRNELDIGLLMGPVTARNIANIELSRHLCSWVAATGFDISYGPLSLRDIAKHPIISFPPASKPHDWLIQSLLEAGVDDPIIYTSNSLATKLRMIRDGIGVGALPRSLIEEELVTGRVRILNVAPSFPPLTTHAAFVKENHAPLVVKVAQMAAEIADGYAYEHPDFTSPAASPRNHL